MSTLKVNKLRDTAGSAEAITLDPNGGAVLAGVTTVTSVKVGAAVTITESGIEASGIGITVANINGAHIGGRNLIINGDMRIAQRATSASSSGYQTVDRFYLNTDGVDEEPTQAQVDVSSGTTPYTEGFRKAYKITNGNQTSGAGSADNIIIQYYIEAQDIACSGWNYTSASSFITLSFWVKSSVAQNYFGRLMAIDGTQQNFPFETGSLTADTWTKIIKTIPGNSNIQVDNDENRGLSVEFCMFRGTDKTGSVTLNQWAAYSSATRIPDMTSTWYTTNDATFEITGVQLEVGPQATPFEHRRLDDELFACQRYYCELFKRQSGESQYSFVGLQAYGTQNLYGTLGFFPRKMRSLPTITMVGTLKFSDKEGGNIHEYTSGTMGNAVTRETVGTHGVGFGANRFIQGGFAGGFTDTDGSDYIKVDAEL